MKSDYHIIFPFRDIERGSSVILYGAGDIGQTFYWQLVCTGYCKVRGWIDQRWAGEKELAAPMCHMQDLSELDYDYIIIAVKSESAAAEIRKTLEKNSIPPDKIIYLAKYIHDYSLCGLKPPEGVSFSALLAQKIGAVPTTQQADRSSAADPVKQYKPKLKIGFLTAGNMAGVMAETIRNRMPEVKLEAAASRQVKKAELFAKKYGIKKYFGSYQELADDPEVELVHVASPAAMHFEHVMMCLKNKKHVLCEKPFALNEQQARQMLDLAKANKLLLADGLWTSYLPLAKKIKEITASRVIGNVCTVSANSYYYSIGSKRINNRQLGGGVLLENGIYLISFAVMILGLHVERIMAAGLVNEHGIDIQDHIVLDYGDKMAVLSCGIQGISDRKGYIYGDQGFIEIQDANEYRKILVYNAGGEIVNVFEMDGGYQYELASCMAALEQGRSECEERNYDEIIGVMKIADEVRRQIGVTYE